MSFKEFIILFIILVIFFSGFFSVLAANITIRQTQIKIM